MKEKTGDTMAKVNLDCRSFLAGMLQLILLMPWCSVALAEQDPTRGGIFISGLSQEVTQSQVNKIKQDLQKAENTGASLFLLKINTPGGLLEPTRALIQAILDSPVPVAGFVAPAGARASSAGTYVLSACHIAAMAPATNVGSATPVMLYDDIDEDRRSKMVNDAAAQLRSLAQLRGRNAEWLEQSVTSAKNITASEALQLNVIDLVSVNTDELLQALHGREVEVQGRVVVLDTQAIQTYQSKPFENVSPLMLWTLLGVALVIMELMVTKFIAIFFAGGAFITGIAVWAGLPTTNGLPLIVFTLTSLVLLFAIRARFRHLFVGSSVVHGDSELNSGMIGARVSLVSGFEQSSPGTGMVMYRGSNWQARSDTSLIEPGQVLVISDVQSNTLWIKAE
ncbi:MAG: NfeD family protein [Pseudomonadota bacterium]|nr:NfeD family protein [Pseudomonadota bacterium]